MKNTILILSAIFTLMSCSKKESCTAKNTQGEDLYEVEGADVCKSQIDTENGEYCVCAI